MKHARRTLLALGWLAVVFVLGRIVSGGAISLGSARYAIASLPVAVSAWMLATCAAGIAVLIGVILDRRWVGSASLALGVATVPLGVALAALSHDSAIAASVLGGLVAALSMRDPGREGGHDAKAQPGEGPDGPSGRV